ncbi:MULTISPECIES: 50S ribosomal protein L30 [Legionella]|uniref:Large ribosomal subunit protein uL30 n=1 Tax=Legionella septentrionalis TaxID=2498109 RepID=A0A3S0XF45_9GAMM|nr:MULTISPECIES: 50S ribosomal protein L30 [Legionella]MCP0913828.1 50S ribosomal protein L30 [Legionella sp. 27cVA30]RUQ81033.1 50S ribosomal protein L30 [Legionella septentrionalis]RUQ98675.1 50S ribosomal protein L30 [Legionella septentrionalis]RUR09953.1 50S ribosomal protein L30 [Legionella septentrionalis]RUR14968.1 50S ribosomal protein L30 [Legionella septentrionalis]
MNNNKIKITLVKSLIGRLPKHIEIARQLGLRKMNHSAIHQDIPQIRGLVNVISYLVKVEESA